MTRTVERRIEWIFTAACLALAGWLLWKDQTARLMFGREAVNIELGLWATRLLLLGLVMTPLSQVLRQPAWKRLRRPLGLAAAGFTLLHAIQYLVYAGIWPDHLIVFVRRRYLTVGLIAFVLLVPLTVTSFNGAVRWMGPKAWRVLHWLVYPAAILTVLHEVWSGAMLIGEIGVHVVLLAALLGWRLVVLARKASPRRRTPARGLAAERV